VICCGVFWILAIVGLLFAIFAVPPIARSLMQRLLDNSLLEVQEVQVISQDGNLFVVRIQAVFYLNTPIEAEGISEPCVLDMLIENPADRSQHLLAGRLNVPALLATGSITYFNTTTTMYIVDDAAVHLFVSDILVADNMTVWGFGEVYVTAFVPIYQEISMTAKVNNPVTFKGYRDLGFTLNYMDLIYGAQDEVHLNFDISIHNPSVIYTSYPISIYNQDLGIYYNETWIGHCEPDNITLGPDVLPNKILGTLVRTDANEEFIADFLSRYILGGWLYIYIEGTAKIDVGLGHTDENLADIFVQWTLPGIQDELVQDLYCPLDEVSPIRLILAAEGKMFNPLVFSVNLLQAEFDAYVGNPCNRSVGRINESWDPPFLFPAQTPVCLTGLDIKLTVDDLACLTAAALTGIQLTAANGAMTMAVEDFQIKIPFSYGPLPGRIGKCTL